MDMEKTKLIIKRIVIFVKNAASGKQETDLTLILSVLFLLAARSGFLGQELQMGGEFAGGDFNEAFIVGARHHDIEVIIPGDEALVADCPERGAEGGVVTQ